MNFKHHPNGMEPQDGLKRAYLIYLMIFLGFMSAFGPFVTDMYLPSLPAMESEFATTASQVQWGITMSLLGLALGQILFGPVSDRYGRKPVMFISLVVFAAATVGDIFSTSITLFNFFRFFQGIGGAGAIVMSRSVATDCYSGRELAKTMAIIGAINGVAPIAAPIAGGFVGEAYGWQGVFWVLLAIGIVLLVLTVPFVESLNPERRSRDGYLKLYGKFSTLLRNRSFMICILVFSLANGVLFSYISSAPFICQNVFGFSDTAFSFIFAVNAISIVLGSSFSLKFRNLSTAPFAGGVAIALMSLVLTANGLWLGNFWVYETSVWISLFGLGLVFPSITAIAMGRGREAVGAASAIVGASGFTAGGIVSPLCGLGDMLTTSGCIMLAFGTFLLFFSKKIS